MLRQIEVLHSKEPDPAILRLSLRSMRLGRHSLNFAHVPMMHAGHLPIVPGDRDCIPTCFGDNAAISGIASPINAGALLEALRFVGFHCCPRCLRSRVCIRRNWAAAILRSFWGRVALRAYRMVPGKSSTGSFFAYKQHNKRCRCQQWAIRYSSRRTAPRSAGKKSPRHG